MKTYFNLFLLLITFGFLSINSFAQELQPTDDEQFMLELINRARMNPAEEGVILANHSDPNIQGAINFFGVDKNAMIQEFSTYPSSPPLAWNPLLTQAARRHSADLKANNFQGHGGTDGSTLSSRITDTGYEWRAIAENVFSFGRSIPHAHAGFVVDWGVPSLGHRKNTIEFHQEPIYTEVGIGILETDSINTKRSNINPSVVEILPAPGVELLQSSDVGPLVVTIDFATTFNPIPKVLGVVHKDSDGNEFYTPGEGQGNITVSIVETGSSTTTYNSGGFHINVSTPGTYTLAIQGDGIQPMQKSFDISQDNVKVDFMVTEPTSVYHWMMY